MKYHTLFLIIILDLASCSSPTKEVFSNFDQRKKEIFLAKEYFSRIKFKNLYFYIRFNDSNTINLYLSQKDDESTYFAFSSIFNVSVINSQGDFEVYKANINDPQVQLVLKMLELNNQGVLKLGELLRAANCKSISNNILANNSYTEMEYCYPTDGTYGLSYKIFDTALKRNLLKELEADCSYKIINPNVVVEFSDGGPTYGSDCFPDKK